MGDDHPMFKERIRRPIPRRELERRWKLIRSAMREKNLDSLIMQNDNQWLGGYVRYFTDIPAESAYPVSVIFPVDEEMTIITSGGKPLAAAPPEWAVRGIKTRISEPYFRTLQFTDSFDAEATVKTIKARNDKRVGIVGLGHLSAAFYLYIKENMPDVEFVNATDIVDEIKAVKSEDEIACIRKAIAAQDIVCAAMPTIIRPGRYEYQIRGDINRILEDLGSEEQLIMMSSAPEGQYAGHAFTFFQNRRVEAGDQVFIMIEVNGPGGYYGEVARTWCLGEPSKDLLKVWSVALEAQKLVANLLKPGANPADILKANNDFMESKGYPGEGRLFGHGQGYDLVERPALRSEEIMPLKAGMNLAIHPIAFNDNAYAFCCDNYLITNDGSELLHKTPQEIIVLDC
jgi:Xaa-Pro aminopeptidase